MTIPEGSVLTQRHLNRALLARQHLLERTTMPVAETIEHLVGMQSQVPTDPYLALWTRLDGFCPEELSRMMLERTAVRASLMRGTIHLVTAPDYMVLQPIMQELHDRVFPSTEFGKRIDPAHVSEIVEVGHAFLEEAPMTLKSIGERLAERWPDRDRNGMAYVVRYLIPLVQTTPRGVWGQTQQATWALAERWLGDPVPTECDRAGMIRRYLAAFGPATVADVQAWSGLTGLRSVMDGLRPELRVYRNERGQELFDVPGAPIPDPEIPAPVRFLPEFDNTLLSHKDRTRIISDERRRAIGSNNGTFFSAYLVDGVVAGTWKLERGKQRQTLSLRPFEQHSPAMRHQIEEEASRLLTFLTDDTPGDVVCQPDAAFIP